MEYALQDKNLRNAAMLYGGIVNAEINADADAAFSPAMFRSSSELHHLLIFVRYSVTLANLFARTIGGYKGMESMMSPDIFRMLVSGNAKAATDAQRLQVIQALVSFTDKNNVKRLMTTGTCQRGGAQDNFPTGNAEVSRHACVAQKKKIEEAKIDHYSIVRGKKGWRAGMAGYAQFAIAEFIIRLMFDLLLPFIPWWQAKQKKIDAKYMAKSLLDITQAQRATGLQYGAGLIPDVNWYMSWKHGVKTLAATAARFAPLIGTLNSGYRTFVGEYLTDKIVEDFMTKPKIS
jgi:hypothetical protein